MLRSYSCGDIISYFSTVRLCYIGVAHLSEPGNVWWHVGLLILCEFQRDNIMMMQFELVIYWQLIAARIRSSEIVENIFQTGLSC